MDTWTLEFDRDATKALKKLDREVARRILSALYRLTELEDPTQPCKALTGSLAGRWRLRVGDHRVILDVQRDRLVLIALDLGHRSRIYD